MGLYRVIDFYVEQDEEIEGKGNDGSDEEAQPEERILAPYEISHRVKDSVHATSFSQGFPPAGSRHALAINLGGRESAYRPAEPQSYFSRARLSIALSKSANNRNHKPSLSIQLKQLWRATIISRAGRVAAPRNEFRGEESPGSAGQGAG